MSKIEDFKAFIKSNPEFAKAVLDKKYTYQQLYETYDMYGETSDVWKSLKSDSGFNVKSILNTIKNINTENLESNLDTASKAVTLLEDITGLKSKDDKKEIKNIKYKELDKFYSD